MLILKNLTAKQLTDGILKGNRTLLSRAITLVESTRPEHRVLAQQIVDACLPYAGKSVRIGITGVPGAGKSTFIDTFGHHLVEKEHKKVAVLAVDPSSTRTRGSILGDKTRMEKLAYHPSAYVRPTPSSGSLGGVARNTRETILLCEAAGFDTILIETVGVGQSETAVHSMVDFFLLLMIAGAGDELQGIKRGIMEMADAIAVNKADSGNEEAARKAMFEYRHALRFFPPEESGWIPKVVKCSALTGAGIPEIWEMIAGYTEKTTANGYFEHRRKEQALYWLQEHISEALHQAFYADEKIKARHEELKQDILEGKITSYNAARELIELFLKK